MRPPRPVITRKADLTFLTIRSDLVHPLFISINLPPISPRPRALPPCRAAAPPPCPRFHTRAHAVPPRSASAPVSPLLAAQRRRVIAAALCRSSTRHQIHPARHRAQAPPPHAHVLCCARTPPHGVRSCCRVDLTLGTLTLAMLSVSFRKVTSLPWIRVCR
jgi:hypothetical protein